MTILYKYRGAGQYFVGIPARDLTRTDFDKLTVQQQALVEQGRLYERPVAAPAPSKKDED